MKKRNISIFIMIILLVIAVAIYFTFFFSYTCDSIACFQAHQEKCSEAKFINDGPDAIWFYEILGRRNGNCEIEVEVVTLKIGTAEKTKLEGKNMVCSTPFGDLSSPEADLNMCHGILKEELQDLTIQRLHIYITENLGEIDASLERII